MSVEANPLPVRLHGQNDQGTQPQNPRPGDLVLWGTGPHDDIPYDGDGDGEVIEANPTTGAVQYTTTTLGGAESDSLVADVLTPQRILIPVPGHA